MNAPIADSPSGRSTWWREIELLVLALLVCAIYGSRLTTLSIRGEESRWAVVAREILATGDWVVPRQQMQTFADRPPLGSWAIAVSMLALGDQGPFAVRLPTFLFTLATTLLIYAYSRNFLSRVGALAAGVAYATAGQILSLGGLAETEATFTFMLGASLLVWHWGHSRSWPRVVTWVAGYSLAGLAALAKGAQGPVYFAAAVILYLACRRDWRTLFSWSHLVGMLAGICVLALWQVPYAMAVSWSDVQKTWGEQTGARFNYSQMSIVLKHLATFPLELAACLLPWSALLVLYARRDFRASLGNAAPLAAFLGIVFACAFPTCWLAPYARTRYLMPIYPCLAPLVGLVVDRIHRADQASVPWRLWRGFLAALCMLAGASAVALPAARWFSLEPRILAQPATFVAIYSAACLAIALLVGAARRWPRELGMRAALLGIATFVGLTYTGVIMNALVASSGTTEANIARLKEILPRDVHLVSFGRAHHLFTYHFRQPVERLPWPGSEEEVPSDVTWFCYEIMPNQQPKPLPFGWQQVAVIPCDRNRHREPREFMVIGRRLEHLETARRRDKDR